MNKAKDYEQYNKDKYEQKYIVNELMKYVESQKEIIFHCLWNWRKWYCWIVLFHSNLNNKGMTSEFVQ